MNIGKWVKTQKQIFILGKGIELKGKWLVEDGRLWIECSQCKGKISGLGINYNYCPHCGANMKGVE